MGKFHIYLIHCFFALISSIWLNFLILAASHKKENVQSSLSPSNMEHDDATTCKGNKTFGCLYFKCYHHFFFFLNVQFFYVIIVKDEENHTQDLQLSLVDEDLENQLASMLLLCVKYFPLLMVGVRRFALIKYPTYYIFGR